MFIVFSIGVSVEKVCVTMMNAINFRSNPETQTISGQLAINNQPEIPQNIEIKEPAPETDLNEAFKGAEALANYNRAFFIKPQINVRATAVPEGDSTKVVNNVTNFRANPEIPNLVEPKTPSFKAEQGLENLEATTEKVA